MKKAVKFLLPFLVLSSLGLSSCDSHKAILTYGNIETEGKDISNLSSEYKYDISYGLLEGKIVSKNENFMVAVTPNTACGCWDTFAAILNRYMNETNTICYRISYDELKDGENHFKIRIAEGYTSFAIFENGNLVKTLCGTVNSDELEDYNSFKSMMSKLVEMPKMYYVSHETVRNALNDSETKLSILYGKSGCPDCAYAQDYILKGYFESHYSANNLYIVDCANKDSEFKTTIGITSTVNQTFGFGTGFYPTFFTYKGNTVTTGAVIFNDTLEKNGDIYKVNETYYTEDRIPFLHYLDNFKGTKVLKGLQVSQVTEYGTWKHEDANKYYKPIMEAYLNYSLPQVNKIL